MRGDEGGEVQTRRPGDPDTYDETGRCEDEAPPRARHGKMAACLGSEGQSKAEAEGAGRVCLGPALCVGGNSGNFRWKDCLTEQPEAGRAWKGGDGGGLSRRVSLGAQGGPVPGSGMEGAEKGRREAGRAGVPSAELGRAAPAFLFGPLVVSGTSDRLRRIREAR